jgi:hypothetical protein
MSSEYNPIPSSSLPSSLSEAALFWFRLGYKVMPMIVVIRDGKEHKQPVVPNFKDWLSNLSEESIKAHWRDNPEHLVAIHCEDSSVIVFDADSQESEKALWELEKEYGMPPLMRVRTKRGVHHYFQASKVLLAKSVGYGKDHPGKIDVRYGSNGLALIAPSTDKTIESDEILSPSELVCASQEFVDAVYRHNGEAPVKKRAERVTPSQDQVPYEPDDDEIETTTFRLRNETTVRLVQNLISHVDPDVPYSDWFLVLTVIFNTLGWREDAFTMADEWSSGGLKYLGTDDVWKYWSSISKDYENPSNINSLVDLVEREHPDWLGKWLEKEYPFEKTETIFRTLVENQSQAQVETEQTATEEEAKEEITAGQGKYSNNPLAQFSLTNILDELESNKVDVTHVLYPIALRGSFTAIFAPSNAGKSLLTFFMLREAIKSGTLDPSSVMYINADDGEEDIILKTRYAKAYGFNHISPGLGGLHNPEMVKEKIQELIDTNQASGIVIIFDTLKRFTNVMDKFVVRDFTNLCRSFTQKGGTVIALGHVNKRRFDGDPLIPEGVEDLRNDVDCWFTLDTKHSENVPSTATYEVKKKRNPNVASKVTFVMPPHGGGTSFEDRIDQTWMKPLNEGSAVAQSTPTAQSKPSTAVSKKKVDNVSIVKDLIRSGVTTKMNLIGEIRTKLTLSKRDAERFLEQHTGTDPIAYEWNYRNGPDNSYVFYVLEDEL